MSSINPVYTFQYSQPSEYQFSHDSVFLAQRVSEIIRQQNFKCQTVLDLCSGCGIIGLDLLFHLNRSRIEVHGFDFLEVQDIYAAHFDLNRQQLLQETNCKTDIQFINANYTSLLSADFNQKYDLIVCNPPYFFTGQGKLSPSDFKNRCRFYIDSDFQNLIAGVVYSLAINGRCYMLLRDQAQHGRDLFSELISFLPQDFVAKKIDPIRGTDLVEICRLGHA